METSAETLARILGGYEIGRKLRQLRLKKKIGLVDLGKHTGLSASMLSQLETGRLVPTLQTLARVAMVFDVGLEYFFEAQSTSHFEIIRAGDRIRFPERPDMASPGYFFECLAFTARNKAFQAYLAEFPVRNEPQMREHLHESIEFIYVLEGRLAIRFNGEDHILETGDSVYFEGSEAHGYRSPGPVEARALVMTLAHRDA